MNDHSAMIEIFAIVGAYTTLLAFVAALYALNWVLVSWWQRRKARPGIEASEARLREAKAEHEKTIERIKANTAEVEEINRRMQARLTEMNGQRAG